MSAPSLTRPQPLTGDAATVAALLDRWLDERIDTLHLVERLDALWTPAGAPRAPVDHDVLLERLRPLLGSLRTAHDAQPDPQTVCDRCNPAELCPFHRSVLYLWHDTRDPIATTVLDLGRPA